MRLPLPTFPAIIRIGMPVSSVVPVHPVWLDWRLRKSLKEMSGSARAWLPPVYPVWPSPAMNQMW